MAENIILNQEQLTGSVRDLPAITIVNVSHTRKEATWDYMVRAYHYLGYQKMIGPRIKYLIYADERPIAALSYNRASLSIGTREEYVGWGSEQKRQLLPHVVNNNRFLILPWVKVKNLASHILSLSLKQLKVDWPAIYGYMPYMVETFVDLNRNKGVCYRAANWVYLGQTKGFGKVGKAFVYHGNPKGVYIYVLNKGFSRIIKENTASRRTLKTANREALMMMLQTPDWNPAILEEAGITVESVGTLADKLLSFIEQFKECFSRKKQYKHAACYIKGLLSDLDRKSIEPIALRYAGSEKEVRNMQYFLPHGAWDETSMLAIYQSLMAEAADGLEPDPDGMLTLDGSCMPKKGTESVGVARQYCGRLGKTDNCQEGVFVGYTCRNVYGLLNARLYMPQKWFEDDYAQRREKCDVPKNLKFQTKPEIASEMIREVMASGQFPARWLGTDSGYGSDQAFLDSLPEGLLYFADIHKTERFFTSMPEVAIPPYKGRGKAPTRLKSSFAPVKAEEIAADPELKWEATFLGEGAKGPIYSKTACIRVIESRDGLPGREVWLYIREKSDGSLKYTKSNAPKDTPKKTLDEQSLKRWPIEQCFEECKSQLGMDHCESRSWFSWHRHMFLVFLAYMFVLTLRKTFKNSDDQPILTFPQAQRLIVSALSGFTSVIIDAIKCVAYYLRRNYFAYLSHKKHAKPLVT